MRRREFLLRAAGVAAGLAAARRATAAPAEDAAAQDSLAREREARAKEHVVTLAVAGDTTLGYNLQTD
jgi:hypothetical protein